jgi:hypothetical protein
MRKVIRCSRDSGGRSTTRQKVTRGSGRREDAILTKHAPEERYSPGDTVATAPIGVQLIAKNNAPEKTLTRDVDDNKENSRVRCETTLQRK